MANCDLHIPDDKLKSLLRDCIDFKAEFLATLKDPDVRRELTGVVAGGTEPVANGVTSEFPTSSLRLLRTAAEVEAWAKGGGSGAGRTSGSDSAWLLSWRA